MITENINDATWRLLDNIEKELRMNRIKIAGLKDDIYERYEDEELAMQADDIIEGLDGSVREVAKTKEALSGNRAPHGRPVKNGAWWRATEEPGHIKSSEEDEKPVFKIRIPKDKVREIPNDILSYMKGLYKETVMESTFDVNTIQDFDRERYFGYHRKLNTYVSSINSEERKKNFLGKLKEILIEQCDAMTKSTVTSKYSCGGYYTYVSEYSFVLPFTNRELIRMTEERLGEKLAGNQDGYHWDNEMPDVEKK